MKQKRTNYKLQPDGTVKFIRSEYTDQTHIIEYLESQYPDVLFNGSPAGARYGKGKEAVIRGAMMRRAGSRKGFPDIFIYAARGVYHGLAIELKREDGIPSDVSDEQKFWIRKLNKQGYWAIICWGYDDAIKVVTHYLGSPERI